MRTLILFFLSVLFSAQLVAQTSKIELQKVVHSDRDSNDWFGFAASISGDYAIASAPVKNTKSGVDDVGAVYLFKRQENGYWKEIDKIEKPLPKIADLFGYGISQGVSIHNKTIAIGCHGDDNTKKYHKSSRMGAIYIYEIDSNDKAIFKQKIIQQNRLNNRFGFKVQMNDSFLVCNEFFGKRISVFKKNEENMWRLFQEIEAPKNEGLFSSSFAISTTNDLIISSGYHDGVVHCYNLNKRKLKFVLRETIKNDLAIGSQISSITVSDNYFAFGLDMGTYKFCGKEFKTDSLWVQLIVDSENGKRKMTKRYIVNDKKVLDSLGIKRLTFSKNATAYKPWEAYLNESGGAGAVLIYKRMRDKKWGFVQKIEASDKTADANFGMCVDLDGKYLIVGAMNEKTRMDCSGDFEDHVITVGSKLSLGLNFKIWQNILYHTFFHLAF